MHLALVKSSKSARVQEVVLDHKTKECLMRIYLRASFEHMPLRHKKLFLSREYTAYGFQQAMQRYKVFKDLGYGD